MIDDSKRRRRGPAPLADADRRTHTVSVRLSDAELAQLDTRRALVRMQRGEYLRAAALHRLPPTIPAINREAWVHLARIGGNLNQIARHLNAGAIHPDEIAAAQRLIADLRRLLLGVKHESED